MKFDYALMLGAQTTAVTSSEATDNYIDFDLTNPNKGTSTVNAELVFTITTTGTGATASNAYTFALQDDTDAGFATALRTLASEFVIGEEAVKGDEIRLKIPKNHKRFIRGYITVAGTVGAMTYEAHIAHQV